MKSEQMDVSRVTNVWKMILKLNNDSVFVSWQLVKLESNLLWRYYPSQPSKHQIQHSATRTTQGRSLGVT